MNTQKILKTYKKQAWDYLKKMYGDTTKDTPQAMEKSFQNLGMKTEKDWEEYIPIYSPEELIQGRISGLI